MVLNISIRCVNILIMYFVYMNLQNPLFAQLCENCKKCENGWSSHDGHCYKIFNSNSMTYYDTQQACYSMNAYLASIDTQNEFRYITSSLLPKFSEKISYSSYAWV